MIITLTYIYLLILELKHLRAKETKLLETDWKLRTDLQQPKSVLYYLKPQKVVD